MGIDPDRFRIPPEMIGGRASRPDLPRHGPRETFIRGPVPFRWLAEASRLPGSGFPVAMGVWYLARRFRRDPRSSVPELAALLGLGRTTTKAALRVAAEAGLIAVRRDPGRKLVLSLREVPATGLVPKPLRGPIPWVWWAGASRLPGPSLRVGAVCWLVAGWRRSAEFALGSGDWAELGLSRFAVARGLGHLDDAGLVSVTHRAGRTSVVRLRDASDNGSGERSEA
jgi:hypothetical protein